MARQLEIGVLVSRPIRYFVPVGRGLADAFPTACLEIAGSRPEASDQQRLAEGLGDGRIRFPGFCNQSQLSALSGAVAGR